MPRTWIALLRGRVGAALAAGTGVEEASDVAGYLLAGADVVMTTSALLRYVVMTTSALLRHGPAHAAILLDGLSAWMTRKGFAAVGELRGILAVAPGADEAAYERAGDVRALENANSSTYGPW